MIRTTCPYCGVGCGIEAAIGVGRQVNIKGDPEHPANRGSLCSKGTHLGETVGLEGRLLHPMIGEEWVSWSSALDEVAGRLKQTVAEHSPDSVGFYVSGQLLTEDYYVANKLAKGFVGTGNIDTNSRLCMASAVAAHVRAFGEDIVPCTYDDLDAADLILLVGSNTAWCHPVIWQRIERARERRGTRLVVIDPRRTETAERADLHLAIEPDGDVALFNALLAELHGRELVDEAFLAEHCDVPEGFWDNLSPSRLREGLGVGQSPNEAQARAHPRPLPQAGGGLGGSTADQFDQLADLVATHPRMVTLFSQGANQSVQGTDKGNAIINLHLALGRINRPGAGPFSITGQPNAMGGREVGGLANMLACHLGFSDAEREDAARFWQAPNICSGPGLKAVEMFRALHDGRIKFLWVMATNPAVSMPDAGFVRAALARCPTVVMSDVIADTDTARFAHIRLPALAWGEKVGTVTNSERRISRQRALFAPPGEARADWRIVCDVAARLGHGAAFAFDSPAAIFREYAAMTALAKKHGKLLDLQRWARCSDGQYDTMEPFLWGGAHPCARRFPTADGKARMVPVAPRAGRGSGEAFPLRLNTGRYRDQWHTMTRTGLSPKLSQHRREPLLEIHPDDAAANGLEAGGLAEVATEYGTAIYRVHVTTAQRPGDLFVPMHWTDAMGSTGRTGRLAKSLADPHSGQPGFKDTPARVAPVALEWRAFLVSREPVRPAGLHWTRARVEGGWLTELAGADAIDTEALLPEGARSEATDLKHGMRRAVVLGADGELAAALFVTRSGTLPSRDWIAAMLGAKHPEPAELLAGRPAKALPDRGAQVCVCHDVREGEVLAAAADGCATVAEIGCATRAGTNCGSCRPLIARLLEEAFVGEPDEPLKEAAQ